MSWGTSPSSGPGHPPPPTFPHLVAPPPEAPTGTSFTGESRQHAVIASEWGAVQGLGSAMPPPFQNRPTIAARMQAAQPLLGDGRIPTFNPLSIPTVPTLRSPSVSAEPSARFPLRLTWDPPCWPCHCNPFLILFPKALATSTDTD